MDEVTRLMGLQEELVPELARCVGDVGFPVVRHPLVYAVPYFPGTNALLNECLRRKRDAAAKAVADRNFYRYVFLHERPYRLNALLEVADELEDDAYWSLVRDVYQDSENVEELAAQWLPLLASNRPGRAALMTTEERSSLDALPDVLTVWRGAADKDELAVGYSWSLSRKVANWFAWRTAEKGCRPLLAEGSVRRSDALAYLETRGEEEILVLPDKVTTVRVLPALGGPGRRPSA